MNRYEGAEAGRKEKENHRTGEETPFTIASEIDSNGMMFVFQFVVAPCCCWRTAGQTCAGKMTSVNENEL